MDVKMFFDPLLNVFFNVKLCLAQMLNVYLINDTRCFDQLLSIPYLMISNRNVRMDSFETFEIENKIKLQQYHLNK